MANTTLTEKAIQEMEEQIRKKKMFEEKREADSKRKELLEQYNNDIKVLVRRLGQESATLKPEQKAQIESQLQETKGRLNAILNEQRGLTPSASAGPKTPTSRGAPLTL